MLRDSDRLQLRGVTHSYGATRALVDVDLTLSVGVVGLLGPNGAGKSTLMNIASTALPPQRGDVFVSGHNSRDRTTRDLARRSLGYLPQRFSVMGWSTCRRNVAYAAWAQGVTPEECHERAEAALAIVDLAAAADRRARTLSGGQRQRLGIACAIVHDPEVLLLDEPTVGLDPVQRSEVREHLTLLGTDRAILLSTHIVEDLDRIADRIIVLNHGKLMFDGSREDLIATSPQSVDGECTLETAYIGLMRRSDDRGLIIG